MSLDFDISEVCTCPHCGGKLESGENYISLNITHNLSNMAKEAGIYDVLWCPNENGCFKTDDIIDILKAGLNDLKARPEYYKQFNSPNGWGMYENFVPWVEEVIGACERYPGGLIQTSR